MTQGNGVEPLAPLCPGYGPTKLNDQREYFRIVKTLDRTLINSRTNLFQKRTKFIDLLELYKKIKKNHGQDRIP